MDDPYYELPEEVANALSNLYQEIEKERKQSADALYRAQLDAQFWANEANRLGLENIAQRDLQQRNDNQKKMIEDARDALAGWTLNKKTGTVYRDF